MYFLFQIMVTFILCYSTIFQGSSKDYDKFLSELANPTAEVIDKQDKTTFSAKVLNLLHRELYCSSPKTPTKWAYNKEVPPKDADSMANSATQTLIRCQTTHVGEVRFVSILFARAYLSENI